MEAVREEWMAEICVEDLPEPYQSLAKRVGIEATIELAEEVGGLNLYFPKLDKTLQRIRDRRLRAEFDGGNHKELARKYNLTESRVRQIVAERELDLQQMRLFSA